MKILFISLCILCASTGFAKQYQGATWVDDECFRYNGSAWETCTKNRYSGSAWEEIEAVGGGVADDFSSDTSADYTATSGGLTISAGEASGSASGDDNILIHGTSLGGSDHYVQADIQKVVSTSSGVVIRASSASASATGYLIKIPYSDKVRLYTFSGDVVTYTNKQWAVPTLTDSTYYTIKVVVAGSTFELWMDTGGGLVQIAGDLTDSTYSTGTYSGLSFDRVAGQDPKLDNFSAE